MPTLTEAMNQDLSAYQPVDQINPQVGLPTQNLEPTLNTVIRCPIPPVYQAMSDNLRQFYQGGQVPQIRLFTQPLQPAPAGGGNNVAGTVGGGSAGGGGGFLPTQPNAQQASITTGNLNPGQTFVNSFLVADSFQLLNISTNSPARVQLYGTNTAQLGDSYRGLDVPTPAGTVQNIICDVVLDTSPYQWSFQNRTGANADSPQTTTVYVTITNLDSTTDVITLTLTYVPIES